MTTINGKQFIRRSAEDLREAAAKLVEREADVRDPDMDIVTKDVLHAIAKRIRRLPVAGLYKKKSANG